jgi:hypothetical protein
MAEGMTTIDATAPAKATRREWIGLTVAAIAADLVAQGGSVGVHAPEAAFEPRPFIDALAERGLVVEERAQRSMRR